MPTNRRTRLPQSRPPEPTITARAVELFREWDSVECSCPDRDWAGEYWKHRRCPGCARAGELHSRLIDELGARPAKPWETIEIMRSDAANPYPAWHWPRPAAPVKPLVPAPKVA